MIKSKKKKKQTRFLSIGTNVYYKTANLDMCPKFTVRVADTSAHCTPTTIIKIRLKLRSEIRSDECVDGRVLLGIKWTRRPCAYNNIVGASERRRQRLYERR